MLASLVPLLVTPVSGYLLDQSSPADQLYLPIFASHCLLRLISLPLIGCLDLGKGLKEKYFYFQFLNGLSRLEMQRKTFHFYWFRWNISRSLTFNLTLLLGFKRKSNFVGKQFLTLLRQKNLQRFFCTFVILGALWGLIETYLFISLSQLGISKHSLGVSHSVATITGNIGIF